MIRKYYSVLLFSILTFGVVKAQAQSDEAAVKAAVNKLFEGMKKSDTALLRSVFSPASIMQTVTKNRNGQTVVLNTPVDSFIVSIGRPHKEVYDERIVFDAIKIDGDLAMAWTPYRFYLDDKFIHCGVNSFQLVRLNGDWKIQYTIDTRRRQPCE